MSFSISGFVKDSETLLGIKDVWITISDPAGNCIETITDSNGKYIFKNLSDIGEYTIYETVAKQQNCPPTVFTQPEGYEESNFFSILSIEAKGEDIFIDKPFIHESIKIKNLSYNPSLDILKESNEDFVAIGDVVTYTLKCVNNGDIELNNIMISDMLADEIEYISQTVTINGDEYKDANILAGINIGTLKIDEEVIITFKVKALDSGVVKNKSIANYTYQHNTNQNPLGKTSYSNVNVLKIYKVSILINKKADKNLALVGDIVSYNIDIKNTGDLDIYNVLFKDELSKGLSFLDGSFYIENQKVNGVNLSQGVNIGTITKNTSISIKYKAIVVSTSYCSKLVNKASANYYYNLPNGSFGSASYGPTSTSTSVVDLALSNFKQLSIEEYLTVPSQKPDVEDINSVDGDIEIIKCHTIETSVNKSIEGQISTGYKLIVHGILKITISYVSCDSCQSVHSAHYSIPFSTFITLPEDFEPPGKIEVNPLVEDVYFRAIDCRIIFINTTALLSAKILQC